MYEFFYEIYGISNKTHHCHVRDIYFFFLRPINFIQFFFFRNGWDFFFILQDEEKKIFWNDFNRCKENF